jgi:hypothetical protein
MVGRFVGGRAQNVEWILFERKMIGKLARSAKLGFALILIGCGLIAGCSRMSPDMEVHERLLKATGHIGVDCGRATTGAENAAATACAQHALSRGAPFFVQYKFTDVDVGGERGIATNGKGQAFGAYYLTAGGKGRFGVDTCTEKQLTVLPDGALDCPD